MSKGSFLTDLRIVLRHLKKLPSDDTNSFRAYTLAQVRANMTNGNKAEVQELRWKVHDAARMVTALGVRKDLLDLHAGEKMTQDERIKLTAYRVGLNTPKLFDPEKEGVAAGVGGDEDRLERPASTLQRTGT